MISESLKINTTLTKLYLHGDNKKMKMRVENRKKRVLMKLINEQITKLEQKELR